MSKLRKYKFVAFSLQLTVILMASGYWLVAAAQAVPDPVQYVVSPETPGPNQQVSIDVQGVGTYIGDANITWSVNGKVVSQGTGQHNFVFNTGTLGSVSRVHVSVNSRTQGTLSHDFTFMPSVINLVWEADTSVPPLYRGKSLYSAGSPLKVVAIPTVVVNGSRIAANALSYQWFRDDATAPVFSGTGRNIILFTGDQLQTQENVSVDVYYGSTKIGHSQVVIPAQNTQLMLYPKDPLRGVIYDQAIPSGISLTGKELAVIAVPYFFANISKTNLLYTWTLNDEEVTGPDSAKGVLTLRQNGSGTGSANLNVAVQNNDSDKLVQTAQALLQIVFGQTSSSGSSAFGL